MKLSIRTQIDGFARERDERRRGLRELGDPAIAAKLDELDTVIKNLDEVERQARGFALQAFKERATAVFNTEGHQRSDALLAALTAVDSEIARRPLSADSVAARLEVEKARYQVIAIGNREKSVVLATTEDAELAAAERADADASARRLLIGALIIALVLGGSASTLTVRYISRALSQAQQLQSAVSFFKLDGMGSVPNRPAPRPAVRSASRAKPAASRPNGNGHARPRASSTNLSGNSPSGSSPSIGRATASPHGIDLDLGAAPGPDDDALFERY